MKTFSHTRPVRDTDGTIISQKPAPVSRVTRAELGGQFGSDRRRRLVVTLCDGDLVQFRPERTRQVVSMTAVDLYLCVQRAQANTKALEKARNRKAVKQAKRLAAKIRYADKKITRQAREANQG